MEDMDVDGLPESTWAIIDGLYEEPREMKKMKIERVHVSDGDGGIGVIIAELDWSDESGVFDPKIVTKAKRTIPRLKALFDELGIKAPILIRHYICI